MRRRNFIHSFAVLGLITLISTVGVLAGFTDKKMGLVFPDELAGLKYQSVDDSGIEESGYMVHYKTGANYKATLYVYNNGNYDIDDGYAGGAVFTELLSVRDGIKMAQDAGYYSHVKYGTGDVYPADGNIRFQRLPMTMKFPTSEHPDMMQSSITYLTAVSGRFIKVRITYPKDQYPDGAKTGEKIVDELITILQKRNPLATSPLKDHILGVIKTLRENATSEKGRQAAGELITFSEQSDAVLVTIDGRLMPWMSNKSYKNGEILLIGFIAGNVEAQLKTGTVGDKGYEGVEFMLELYEKHKAQGFFQPLKTLDDWTVMKNKGTLRAHLESLK